MAKHRSRVRRIAATGLRRIRECAFPYRAHLDRNRCIFIHVPKVAGTSILAALGKKTLLGREHLAWHVFQSANPEKFASYFKFAFVRNPWDRTLSAYRYLAAGGNRLGDVAAARLINEYGGFDDFVVRGLGSGRFRSHILFVPQSTFLVGQADEIMVDFVGRFESLRDDFDKVRGLLGLERVLPRENEVACDRCHYSHAYSSAEAIEIVRDIYRQDAIMWGYDFCRPA